MQPFNLRYHQSRNGSRVNLLQDEHFERNQAGVLFSDNSFSCAKAVRLDVLGDGENGILVRA
jgi:hypothetical protein